MSAGLQVMKEKHQKAHQSVELVPIDSYWVTRLTDEETNSEEWQLEDYIEKIYEEIALKTESLAPFFESGGSLELYVSLFGARNFGFILNPDLLSRLGLARIELQLDIYPE